MKYFFEFLHNIFFRHEILKDREVAQNDGFRLAGQVPKTHVFGSSVSSFDFRAPRPVSIKRACECGPPMVIFEFLHNIFFGKTQFDNKFY